MGDDPALYIKQYCPDFHDNVFGQLMVLTRFSSIVLTYLSFAIGLWYKEIYLLFLGFGLTLDSLLNWGLMQAFEEPPPYLGCGHGWGMPSFFSQHAFFLWMMLMTFGFFWKARLTLWHVLLVTGFAFASSLGQVYLHFNTPEQVIVGAMIGMVWGMIYQVILYFLVYPFFSTILSWRIVCLMGYHNDICIQTTDDFLALKVKP